MQAGKGMGLGHNLKGVTAAAAREVTEVKGQAPSGDLPCIASALHEALRGGLAEAGKASF